MNTEQIMVLADAYAAQQSHADWQAEEGWKEDVIAAAQQAAAEARAALEAALTEKQEPVSLQCAHCYITIKTLNDKVLYLMKQAEQNKAVNQQLLEALNAMLTHMGMDEDEWNKPTFDQARAAIAAAEGKV